MGEVVSLHHPVFAPLRTGRETTQVAIDPLPEGWAEVYWARGAEADVEKSYAGPLIFEDESRITLEIKHEPQHWIKSPVMDIRRAGEVA